MFRRDDPSPCTPGAPRNDLRLAVAGAELVRVRRIELARLLRDASGIGGAFASHGPFSPVLGPLPVLGDWRARAERELVLGLADGLTTQDIRRFLRLFEHPPWRWEAPTALARASLDLVDDELGRLALGHALLAEGKAGEAQAVFVGLLRRGLPPSLSWRAFEAIALGHEQGGGIRLALAASEAAGRQPACGAGPLVHALFLALALGDRRGSRRTAARLDRRVAHDTCALARQVERLRLRVEGFHGGLPWLPPGATAPLLGDLARRPSAASAAVASGLVRAAEPAR